MSTYNIAIYIRLSSADEETGRNKDESDSIVHQRMLINRFLDENKELCVFPRLEFCDDGYSGTHFDRPAFKQMIKKIRNGSLNLVVVKDFSRFSRDYIEIGDYLECIFPFLKVRFISVNDRYDSNNYLGTTGGLDVVMRNIVYAAYSKDLSEKVKTARMIRKQKGQYIDDMTPMGYIHDPDDGHRLIIDEEAAATVRKIFCMAIEGRGTSEIAMYLNTEGVLTPAQYYNSRNPGSKRYLAGAKSGWTHTSVRSILKRFVYTGALIANKSESIKVGSNKRRLLEKDKWIITKGQFQPIISEEEFYEAQKVFRKVRDHQKKCRNYPLKSLVRCGGCGRMMVIKNKNKSLSCIYKNDDAATLCSDILFSPVKELENMVFNAIRNQLDLIGAEMGKQQSLKKQRESESKKHLDHLASLEKRVDQLKQEKLLKYEVYAAGNISREDYLSYKRKVDQILESIDEEMHIERMALDKQESGDDEFDSIAECRSRFKDQTELTNEMAKAFVKAIYILPEQNVEIVWRFKDFFDDEEKEKEK